MSGVNQGACGTAVALLRATGERGNGRYRIALNGGEIKLKSDEFSFVFLRRLRNRRSSASAQCAEA
jgi:hypothetical protein